MHVSSPRWECWILKIIMYIIIVSFFTFSPSKSLYLKKHMIGCIYDSGHDLEYTEICLPGYSFNVWMTDTLLFIDVIEWFLHRVIWIRSYN